MITLNDEQFEEAVLQSHLLILISLGHAALGSSYLLQQRLQVLETHFATQIRCYHFEVHQSSTFITAFNIAYLPSLLIFQSGELIEQCQASLPLDVLRLKVKLLISQ